MGQWLANFFKSQGVTVLIAGRKTRLSIENCAKRADIVIICVPIAVASQVISQIAPLVKRDSLLTDITSLKVEPLRAMEKAKSGTLGMHPLFGPTPGELAGQTIVFCRQKDNRYVDFLKKLFQKSGIEVIETDPKTHDKTVAYIQALTHAINLLLSKSLTVNRKLSTKIRTPIFSLQSLVMGRVLEQDLSLLADIQLYNSFYLPVLKNFVANAQKLLQTVAGKDKNSFIKMFVNEQETFPKFSNFAKKELPINFPVKTSIKGISPKVKIAYLGPEGTYSHETALNIFPKNRLIAYPTVYDAFNSVATANTELAVVPAENSIGGTVAETLDYLAQFNLYVVGSCQLSVHHYLVSKEKSLKDIQIVKSHPQAIAQCRQWLKTNLPKSAVISTQSTTSEIKLDKKGCGYIASMLAAQKYRLNVLAKNIEDLPANKTKFYVISKEPFNIKGLNNNKTLLFLTVPDRVGILRDILNVFASYNINLSKLESRPSRVKPWDYHFFVEVEKVFQDNAFIKALGELKVYCPIIRVLGKT